MSRSNWVNSIIILFVSFPAYPVIFKMSSYLPKRVFSSPNLSMFLALQLPQELSKIAYLISRYLIFERLIQPYSFIILARKAEDTIQLGNCCR